MPRSQAKKSTGATQRKLILAAEKLVPIIVEQAMGGCLTSQQMVLSRVIPTLKPVNPPRPIKLDGLQNKTPVEAQNLVIEQAVEGEIGLEAADTLVKMIDITQRTATASKLMATDLQFTTGNHETMSSEIMGHMLSGRITMQQGDRLFGAIKNQQLIADTAGLVADITKFLESEAV